MLIITIKVNILLETFEKYLQLNYDWSKRQSKARHLPYTNIQKSLQMPDMKVKKTIFSLRETDRPPI